jgi:exosortase D (VPLPA-CTERM-specific)
MNSFRIGVIGVLSEYRGQSIAEGFLHDFEGWIIFMACSVILALEIWLLSRFGRDRKPFVQAFVLDPGVSTGETLVVGDSGPRRSSAFWVSLVLVMAMLLVSLAIPEREEVVPARKNLSEFPVQLGQWRGDHGQLAQIYIDQLKVEDNIVSAFQDNQGHIVDFYVAYYGSQRKGASAHSPRSCMPGGGWQLQDLQEVTIEGVELSNRPLQVNRVVIQMGDRKQLVYYWFQQRGRNLTNEFEVKWYLFVDALLKNRTDGALVRLSTVIQPGDTVADGDQRIRHLLENITPLMQDYVPD